MKVEESRKKVELKSTFSRVEKMKVEVDKSTRTFECSTFFRSVHATVVVVDIMVPSHSVIRSHKKKIESSPSMIFPQGMVTS